MSDCSICLEKNQIEINYIKTECGHEFHSNCFLTNVAYNGFNCPYCRNKLVVSSHPSNSDTDSDTDTSVYTTGSTIPLGPPDYYVLDRLNILYGNLNIQDFFNSIINLNIEHTDELLDNMHAAFDYITEYYNNLTKEEQEIELMRMEDKNYNEIREQIHISIIA